MKEAQLINVTSNYEVICGPIKIIMPNPHVHQGWGIDIRRISDDPFKAVIAVTGPEQMIPPQDKGE